MRPAVLAHAFSTDLAVALDAARLAGYVGVALDPTVYPDLVDASQTGRREIVRLLDRAGQALVAIDVRLGNLGLSPRGDVGRELDAVGRAMELARGLRGTLVLCDLGPLPPAPDEPPPPAAGSLSPSMLGRLILPDPSKSTAAPRPPVPRDAAFESSVENALRELGERADRAGCLVAFRSTLGSFASLAFALSRVDCPWFGVDLDPLALLADEWDADAVFSRLGHLLRHVRGRDGVKGAGNRVISTEMGKGQVDWPALAARCRDADYGKGGGTNGAGGFVTLDPIDLPNRAAGASRGAAMILDLPQ